MRFVAVLAEAGTPVDGQTRLQQAQIGKGGEQDVVFVLLSAGSIAGLHVDGLDFFSEEARFAVERGSHVAATAGQVEQHLVVRVAQQREQKPHAALELLGLFKGLVVRAAEGLAEADGIGRPSPRDVHHLLDRRPPRPCRLVLAQIQDDALDVELREGENARQIVVIVRVVVRVAEVGGMDDGDLRLRGLHADHKRQYAITSIV